MKIMLIISMMFLIGCEQEAETALEKNNDVEPKVSILEDEEEVEEVSVASFEEEIIEEEPIILEIDDYYSDNCDEGSYIGIEVVEDRVQITERIHENLDCTGNTTMEFTDFTHEEFYEHAEIEQIDEKSWIINGLEFYIN